ncbi:hypothetical protein OH686_23200 [Pseudomonas sp. SO81]|nr:hypothetical protein OH686_23200 [Pseudomonas sp. SO81]
MGELFLGVEVRGPLEFAMGAGDALERLEIDWIHWGADRMKEAESARYAASHPRHRAADQCSNPWRRAHDAAFGLAGVTRKYLNTRPALPSKQRYPASMESRAHDQSRNARR